MLVCKQACIGHSPESEYSKGIKVMFILCPTSVSLYHSSKAQFLM